MLDLGSKGLLLFSGVTLAKLIHRASVSFVNHRPGPSSLWWQEENMTMAGTSFANIEPLGLAGDGDEDDIWDNTAWLLESERRGSGPSCVTSGKLLSLSAPQLHYL